MVGITRYLIDAGDEPLTIDMGFTVCQTYEMRKQSAHLQNYARQRSYPLAVAVGTGDMLISRLRKGRAYTDQGAWSSSMR